jgi:hypothetical protein
MDNNSVVNMDLEETQEEENVSLVATLRQEIDFDTETQVSMASQTSIGLGSSAGTGMVSVAIKEALKKEFKIVGEVGEPGQKDKLTYVSLIRQVEVGLRKGYLEKDVVNAVIRSISPGLKLRSYLEGLEEITLEFSVTCHTFSFPGGKCHGSVQGTLRDHAKERGDCSEFHYAGMDLRQKILFVCRDSDDIVYNQQQVQKMFLRSVQTALTSEVIRNEQTYLLNDSDIENEVLLEKINVATHFEEERAAKQSISKTRTQAAAVKSIQGPVVSRDFDQELNEIKAQVYGRPEWT